MNGTSCNLLIFLSPAFVQMASPEVSGCCIAHFRFRNITEQYKPVVVFAFNISAFSSNVKF